MNLEPFAWPEDVPQPLQDALTEIRRRAAGIVDPPVLVHFTDHSVLHFDNVARNFIRLAGAIQDKSSFLNQYEWFVGLAAAYLHDVALQSTTKAVSNKPIGELTPADYVAIRKQHGVAAANLDLVQCNRS